MALPSMFYKECIVGVTTMAGLLDGGRWMARFRYHRWLFPLVAGLFLGSASLVSAEVAWPVGELDVQGTAIITKASGGSVTVTNGTYTWFPGDRVENRAGQSLLILDNGTSFGFGESTIATVVTGETGTTVEITQGSVLFTATTDDVVEITDGQTLLSTELNNPPVCTLGPVASVGLVQVTDDGTNQGSSLEVDMLEGALLTPITSATGEDEWYALNAGDSYYASGDSVRSGESEADSQLMIPLAICALADGTQGTGTAAVASVTQATAPSEAMVTSGTTTAATTASSAKLVVGGFAIAVTAASTYVVAFDDDDEPVTEPPVSP